MKAGGVRSDIAALHRELETSALGVNLQHRHANSEISRDCGQRVDHAAQIVGFIERFTQRAQDLLGYLPLFAESLLSSHRRLPRVSSDSPGRVMAPRCESCGRLADIRLDDGSTWCLACDASARNLGYDDRRAEFIEGRFDGEASQ